MENGKWKNGKWKNGKSKRKKSYFLITFHWKMETSAPPALNKYESSAEKSTLTTNSAWPP